MTEVNVPLLRKALEWAEAEAERPAAVREWDQSMWVSTSEDRELNIKKYSGVHGNLVALEQQRQEAGCGTCYCLAGYLVHVLDGQPLEAADNDQFSYYDAGAHVLGLSVVQAVRLFAPGNSIEGLRVLAEEFAGEKL